MSAETARKLGADGVVFGMVEIVDIVNVGSDFWRKEFCIHRRLFCAGVAGEPGEVRERKGFSFRRLGYDRFFLRTDRSDGLGLGDDIRSKLP